MNKLTFPKSGRGALVVVCAALVALAGQAGAASTSSKMSGDDTRATRDSGVVEAGTIPAARPGLPQIARGAEGPVRSDTLGRASGDPSIRDSNPLTVNGLWETQAGNRVTSPGRN